MFKEHISLTDISELLDWQSPIYLLLTIILLLVAKAMNQLLAGYKLDHQLTTIDNKAVAVSFSGFLLALCLILNGVLCTPTSTASFWSDLVNTILWAGLGCFLLLTSRLINDKLLLPKFSNKKELITDRNVGVGAVQAGGYIATALIIRGVIMDAGFHPLSQELLLTVIWFIASQALFLVCALIYDKLTSFSLHDELLHDNASAGVSFGGSLVALGILLSTYLHYYYSLLGLLLWGVIAIILLKIVRVITDKLLLPKHKLDEEISQDQNWGAALIEVAISIGSALILSATIF